MAVPDPYLIEISSLPRAASAEWLDRDVPQPLVRIIKAEEAESVCREIIADSERRLQGTRPIPSILNMVEGDGSITVRAVVIEALRARQGRLGRPKELANFPDLIYGVLARYHGKARPLPSHAILALMHELRVAAVVKRREVAERLVQTIAQQIALYHIEPDTANLASRIGMSKRYVQQLRKHPGVRVRLARMIDFFGQSTNSRRLVNQAGSSDPQLIDDFRAAIPNEWADYGDDVALRAIASFLTGTPRQKAIARYVVYRMVSQRAFDLVVTPPVLMHASALALGIKDNRRS